MGFRYDMQNKTPQQQAIVRQRDNTNELIKKEEEKKRLELIKNGIVQFLESQKEPKNIRDIAENLKSKEADVLKVINILVKENKIESSVRFDKETNVNIPLYRSK